MTDYIRFRDMDRTDFYAYAGVESGASGEVPQIAVDDVTFADSPAEVIVSGDGYEGSLITIMSAVHGEHQLVMADVPMAVALIVARSLPRNIPGILALNLGFKIGPVMGRGR